ncbi:MAG: 1-phosphofructokinase [Erysipelotrichaceae bacterium]|nr:1-phosphofructokinase [Erysipelotrichaceae bacterium]
MIYTVTCNPSIDLFVQAELVVGELNRVESEEYMPGGKGINVSIIAHELGAETVATGFLGGFTGEFVKNELDKAGVANHFIPCNGITRINMKVAGIDETEINLRGLTVERKEYQALVKYLESVLTSEDAVILSGSTASGVTQDDYLEICELANQKGALLVVDTSRAYLEACLSQKPFLIKPNVQELAEILKRSISGEDEIVDCAKKLQEKGAQNVLVSNGRHGAILVTEEGVYYGESLEGVRVNSIGAGDSMVAGFVVEWMRTKDYKTALKMGLTCGSCTAFTDRLAKGEEILKRLPEAVVTQ